jgi:hypothetical protein
MREKVIKFKSLNVALKELERFVRDGAHLRTGKPFDKFDGLRSRELLGNWLLCAALNFETDSERFTFTSDPTGGDGVIFDHTTENTWPTEHVFVPPRVHGDVQIEQLILNAIDLKRDKGGAAYASGKTLVVLLDSGGGEWFPNRVAKAVPEPLLFDTVWVVGLYEVVDGQYVYFATCLDLREGNAPSYKIYVARDFRSWTVEKVQ